MKRSLRRREMSPVPLWGGARECRARADGAKAMEAVQILDGSREGLPGVRGAERIDGGGGNWGGPPRPGDLRMVLLERRAL